MSDQVLTAGDLYRLLAVLGAVMLGINAMMMGVTVMLSGRRASKKDDWEEGERRAELRNLTKLATENVTRWDKHDEFVDQRLEELRATQRTLDRVALQQERAAGDIEVLRGDVRGAVQVARDAGQAAREASNAITRLAEGIVVSARIGMPALPPTSHHGGA